MNGLGKPIDMVFFHSGVMVFQFIVKVIVALCRGSGHSSGDLFARQGLAQFFLTLLSAVMPVEALHFTLYMSDTARKELRRQRHEAREARLAQGSKRLQKVADHNSVAEGAFARVPRSESCIPCRMVEVLHSTC
jgi:hypothetical protein